jgi:hypothetical protein
MLAASLGLSVRMPSHPPTFHPCHAAELLEAGMPSAPAAALRGRRGRGASKAPAAAAKPAATAAPKASAKLLPFGVIKVRGRCTAPCPLVCLSACSGRR